MAYAGDIIRAGDLSTDWADFTPVFANFTVGAGGAVAGRWRRIANRMIVFRAQFTMGTGSSVGGALGLTVPGGLSGDAANLTQNILATGYDVSAASGYTGSMKLQAGGGTALDRIYSGGVAWTTTVPFTWNAADGDWLEVQGWLEVTT